MMARKRPEGQVSVSKSDRPEDPSTDAYTLVHSNEILFVNDQCVLIQVVDWH